MKKLIPAVVFSLTALSVHAVCNKKVDPNKVMLFVDTNDSGLEIATSEKAACQRGERLVVVPKNYKEYEKYITASENARKKYESCQKTNAPCADEQKKYSEARTAHTEFSYRQKNISVQTKEAMEEIKNAGGKLQNVTISGHDGGGHFGGHKGGFSRYDFARIIKDFPEINDVKSLLLLGCYTGVPKEVIEWKHIFPEIKIIAGYDGSAPLSDKPAGHQYITDILLKEKQLLQNADQKKLQSYAKQAIQGLSMMNAAMYLECNDGTNEAEFYYGSQKEGKNFRPFDIKECEGKRNEIEQLNATIQKYQSGELEPPKDTANGELRQIYNQARRIEHCGEIVGTKLNLNAVFNLLFYEGVKKNYTNFYKDDLAEVEKILADMSIEDIEKGFKEEMDKQGKDINELKEQIARLEKDPEGVINDEKKIFDNAKAERDKVFNDPKFAQVKNYIDPETGAYVGTGGHLTDSSFLDLFKQLFSATQTYNAAKSSYESLKYNPKRWTELRKQQLEVRENIIQSQNTAFEDLKQKFNSPEGKVWVPTAENLSKKTRAETLKNMHNASRILSIPGVPAKQRQALTWLTQTGSFHLNAFQNPFSWHEFTGQTEAPQYPMRLRNFESGNGYGYGLSDAGSFVGGMGGYFGL